MLVYMFHVGRFNTKKVKIYQLFQRHNFSLSNENSGYSISAYAHTTSSRTRYRSN